MRLRCIGRLQNLPAVVRAECSAQGIETRSNTGMVLRLALLRGRSEIARGCLKAFGADVQAWAYRSFSSRRRPCARSIRPGDPRSDLIIRTAGEMRLSIFSCGN
ncbi:MAG: undecaprenyl diphosphate synthase family protein [Planctomycetes bacterium]|nr:undecaprenyl diphosphate synthase family protein [Planctomycetota bacterium]